LSRIAMNVLDGIHRKESRTVAFGGDSGVPGTCGETALSADGACFE
jgi:hypothetical protein